jgi:enamine deaminase RidA (YjgF/YER057c/UK114 family)
MTIDARLKELGIELPPVPQPAGNYVHAVQAGNLLFLSGKGPGGEASTGKVGRDVPVEEAYQHARSVGLTLIAVMREALGDLERVNRVVKVLGMVNATPEFGQQPAVINGCSDLFVEVFGDKGRHARSAVGMGSLPGGITVEIECIVEIA